MPVPLSRKVIDITVFYNAQGYAVKDFSCTKEDQDRRNVMQLNGIRRFLLRRVFPSALSEIRKGFYLILLNFFGHLDGFPGIGMFQGSDCCY